jgi:tripartite-type tricarboxylate transporter receptor subunit TctC
MQTIPYAAAALVAAAMSASALGQTAGYPTRVVKFIVPVAAGGTVDIVARTLAQRMTDALGHQVIVENRPSASSLVGTQVVAKSPPDGYTLLATSTTFLSAPAGGEGPRLRSGERLRADHADLPRADGARREPQSAGALDQGIHRSRQSAAGRNHVCGFRRGLHRPHRRRAFRAPSGHQDAGRFSTRATRSPIVEVIGGQVAMMFDQVGTSAPYIRAGKLRPLGITSKKRSQLFPDLPTIDESGLPGYEDYTVNVLLAPAGTSKEILARLHAEVTKIAGAPELHKRFLDQGIELIASPSPDDFAAYVKSEVARYAKLAKDAGIKAD